MTKRWEPKDAAEVERLYRDGHTASYLRKRYGINRDTMSAYLKRMGFVRNTTLNGREFFFASPADAALFAGLLLGEGSIVLRDGANGQREVIISIVNTDPDIIDRLAAMGGRIYWSAPRPPRGVKRLGTWRLSRAGDVLHCLKTIRPFLVGVKLTRADEGIANLVHRFGLSGI